MKNQYVNDNSLTCDVADTPMLPDRPGRVLAFIANRGVNPVFLRFHAPPKDSLATVGSGILLVAGGGSLTMDLSGMFYGAISGIANGGVSECTIIEVYEV